MPVPESEYTGYGGRRERPASLAEFTHGEANGNTRAAEVAISDKVTAMTPSTTHVLTVTADALTTAQAARAARVLEERGARLAEPVWLAAGMACDLPFDGLEPTAAEKAVREALDSAEIDLAAQPTAGRRKRLLIADMESTIIQNEMLDELADFVGLREKVAEITARAMNDELDFRAAMEERVALLEGLPTGILERALDERLELSPGAAVLISTSRAHGVYTALVSGGFTFFTESVKERLGFDLQVANQLEVRDGRLTGRVLEPLRGRAAKLETLEELCRERDLGLVDTIAVGDGANDLAMLGAAGLGVAYHAKPSVARTARFRVEHGDLRTLLYFQGYHQDEFRTPD